MKKEREAVETMLYHAERDQDFGVGGSFGDGADWLDKNNNTTKKDTELKKAKLGVEVVRWILKTYLD